jgi:ureidoacrylate peracid hydrolase
MFMEYTPLSLEERIDPRKTALVVVDVQNDFCHSDGAHGKLGGDLSAAQRMVPQLNLLVDAARGAGAQVIWIRTNHDERTTSKVAWEQRQRRRPGAEQICIPGSWGADFYGVEPVPGEAIVTKHRYSAFVNTDLELLLRSRGIETVIVTGVATNVCVESTARDAFMRDYYVVLVDDCSAAYSPERHTSTLNNIAEQFGLVVKSAEIFETWDRLGTSGSEDGGKVKLAASR